MFEIKIFSYIAIFSCVIYAALSHNCYSCDSRWWYNSADNCTKVSDSTPSEYSLIDERCFRAEAKFVLLPGEDVEDYLPARMQNNSIIVIRGAVNTQDCKTLKEFYKKDDHVVKDSIKCDECKGHLCNKE